MGMGLLLRVPGLWGGGGDAHMMQWDFTGVYGAGAVPSPYSEGYGDLTKIDDTAGITSMSGGQIVINGDATAKDDPLWLSAEIPHDAGYKLHAKPTRTSGTMRIGWFRGGPNTLYTYAIGSNTNLYAAGFSVLAMPNPVEIMIILRRLGAWMLDYDGSTWTLRMPSTTIGSASTFGFGANVAGAINCSVDFMTLDAPAGKWTNPYCLATDAKFAPVDGDTLATLADTWVSIDWIPNTGETIDLQVRRIDDSNCWLVRCDQAAGTIKLFDVQGGVETEHSTGKTQTFTVDTVYTISVYLSGPNVITFVNSTKKNSVTDATFNQTATGAKAVDFVVGAAFMACPVDYGATIEDGDDLTPGYFLTYGDSKTVFGGWQDWLKDYATGKSGDLWTELTAIAASGATTSQMKGTIDADLAAAAGTPDFILYNLGVNDTASLPVEATFKANVLYIWDAMHIAYPDAAIYVMRVWNQSEPANCATLNGWLDDCIAMRSFAYAGPDEQIWLENGDDGARMTTDGTHYSGIVGKMACAEAWVVALGI